MSKETFVRPADSRLRLMLRNTWVLATAGILLLGGAAAAAVYLVNRPTTLKIAVAAGSEDMRVVQAIAQQLARDQARIRLQIISRDTSAESGAAIDNKVADLAVVRADVDMPRNGLAVVILRRNVLTLFVPAAGSPAAAKRKGKPARKIEKIGDLAGTRIGGIGRIEANLTLLKSVLIQYGVNPEKVTMTQIPVNEIGSALRAGQFDVVMAVGPVNSRFTAEALLLALRDKESPTFLAIDASEAIAQRLPIYEATEIPAGAFGGSPPKPEESVKTVGVSHYIVARKTLFESTAAELTKLLLGARPFLAAELPTQSKIEAPSTDKDAGVVVHPGAAAYIDGEQQSFLDKYSEWLYLALFGLSVLGSVAAALASRARASARIDMPGVLGRLVELLADARAAASPEQLDDLQSEVDRIYGSTLKEVGQGALDPVYLPAFSLALDQARQAISARRAVLLAGGPREPVANRAEDRAEILVHPRFEPVSRPQS